MKNVSSIASITALLSRKTTVQLLVGYVKAVERVLEEDQLLVPLILEMISVHQTFQVPKMEVLT